ncbi:unnamed protein product [Phytophthora fragariaefolia]|uniref:Unnamed protein product n=1 Tax=Phytophthora fragariaefolia TaxID=1490495 RepID=A0A9W6YH23_9STRA|nr:unnamed protein product [Phytophthora fragariaefolia]
MNNHTVRRTLPMPRKDVIFEQMQGAYWYNCMDFLSGYYQFRMRDSDIKYTAFQTADGSFEYLVVPMGLSNAPATVNDGTRKLLKNLTDFRNSYFDDIYIFTQSRDLNAHLTAVGRVLSRLKANQFYVKLSKCNTDNAKRKMKLHLTPEQVQHFEQLKHRISATPILAVANLTKSFYVRMDTMAYAIGGVLYQMVEHGSKVVERPVAFNGSKYKGAEKTTRPMKKSYRQSCSGSSVEGVFA